MKGIVFFIVFCSVVLSHTAIENQNRNQNDCDFSRKDSPQMVKLPTYKNAWQIQKGCIFPERQKVAYAMRLFYREWKNKFGDEDGDVLRSLNKLVITWEDKRKKISGIGFNVNGKPLSGLAWGLTLTPSYVWVWTNPTYKRIAARALIHELVHSALWSKNKLHGDPDHEGNDFKGWTREHTIFIAKVNSILAYKDI